MNINTIRIINIKGIADKKFDLELAPNKPNILVAPNGFGKSSLAIAFNSLKRDRIELDKKNYYNNKETNRPALSLELSTGENLEANDTSNSISDFFDVFVIKNQTEPKSVVHSYNGKTFAKTTLDIIPTVLVQTIPYKQSFAYSLPYIKAKFGDNGNKLLVNISNFFSNANLFYRIENEIDFSRFNLVSYKTTLSDAISKINGQIGTGKNIKNWLEKNVLSSIEALDEYSKFFSIIKSFNFSNINSKSDLFLSTWQLLTIRENLGADFRKACKYLFYLNEKEHYKQTIDSFNPVKNRFDIKPTEVNNSLIVKWPKAHEVSNGQRDILTFIALLFKSKRNFKKENCILIIDEIFDYLDDANLVSFQYYISTFIDDMKRRKKRIFPVLLTHLDPLFFNHFCFNDSRIKVNYLKNIESKSSKELLKLIYNRSDEAIQKDVDKYFFHYHPNISAINLTTEFAALKLNTDWAEPERFFKKIHREIRRYLFEEGEFDPLAICFGVRVQVEKLVYNSIPDETNKDIFIEEKNGTKKKLHFAQSIGVQIPETYFLLGIIYNTSLHLAEGQNISKPLGIKLENGIIKQMIRNIFDSSKT